MATLLRFGEPPDTRGGDFERQCAETLAEKLPSDYTVIANLALPTRQSNFYDFDIIVASAAGCEVLECKLITPDVRVGEDFVAGRGEFTVDHVFSLLETKCRVLGSRLKDRPFANTNDVRAAGRVIVPDGSVIQFLHEAHQRNRKVMAISEYVRDVRAQPAPPATGRSPVATQWNEYRSKYQAPGERRDGMLGRFRIRKRLEAAGNGVAYLAVDEPPCKVDVHLLEIPFPARLRGRELDAYLDEAARAMKALRSLRHPLIHCVTGHFYTGSSLVQISDWFEGRSLELLVVDESLSLDDKLLLMSRVTEALVYCHQHSVFHRNIHPANVLVAGNCNDLQLTGFECVKDARQDGTAMAAELGRRDKRIIPPEELQPGQHINYRLYDIFQAGVLFFWILEDGRWPFDSTYDYVTGNGRLEFSDHADPRCDRLKGLISAMLAIESDRRPDPFQRILSELNALD